MSKFCSNCGASTENVKPSQNVSIMGDSQQKRKKGKNNKNRLVLILTLCLCFVFVLAGYGFIRRNDIRLINIFKKNDVYSFCNIFNTELIEKNELKDKTGEYLILFKSKPEGKERYYIAGIDYNTEKVYRILYGYDELDDLLKYIQTNKSLETNVEKFKIILEYVNIYGYSGIKQTGNVATQLYNELVSYFTIATGDNTYGQCNVSDWTDIKQISAGVDHTVILKGDGTVTAVGNNESGQCDTSVFSDAKKISAGFESTLCLSNKNTIQWVGNPSQKVKLMSTAEAKVKDIFADYFNIGFIDTDGVVEVYTPLGDLVNYDLSPLNGSKTIALGGNHTVGLKSDGQVIAVGNNEKGQCNVSDWTDIKVIDAGASHTVGLK